MIAPDSGFGMGVGRFSRPPTEVGVITMTDSGLDTMRHVEVFPDAGVLPLLSPGMAVVVYIDRRCVVDWVEVMR
jgi:hypothetical protein